MSYTPEDAIWDEAWETISQELYPEHKEQAINEFTLERLQAFYLKHPEIIRPGIKAFQEADGLLMNSPSASFVFFTTAIELFLKASILKPIVYGLVHHDMLAEAVVKSATNQTGFDRYNALISKLFLGLAKLDIKAIKREGSNSAILAEAKEVQTKRNAIIHCGESASKQDAEIAKSVASTILEEVVIKMLEALKLRINDCGYVSNKI